MDETPTPASGPERSKAPGGESTTALNAAPAADSPTRIVDSAVAWCPAYRHAVGWRSHYGEHLICASCHPPVLTSLVAEWFARDPASTEQPLRPAPEPLRPHVMLTDRADEERRQLSARDFRRQQRQLKDSRT